MSNQTKGTHEYQDDPRNADIRIDINGEHFSRDAAKVSVFDSGEFFSQPAQHARSDL